MTYEQLSYWEGFTESSPWLFDNLWSRINYDLSIVDKDEEVNTGYWFVGEKKEGLNETSGIVIYAKDYGYNIETLFISRLTPAGFISKKQLLINKDLDSGSTSYKLTDIRKNWRYFEFEPWTSLTEDRDHISSLEFDISELALSACAQDSITLEKITAGKAISFYKSWFETT